MALTGMCFLHGADWHVLPCRENRNNSLQACAEAGLSRTLPNLARKPRILVCAPSNAATDELLQRIMDHGFSDFQVSKLPDLLIPRHSILSCVGS